MLCFFHNILDGIGYSASVRAELIGIYSGEYKLLINVPLALTSSIGIALIPTVTRSVTQHKKREVYGKINQIIRLTMVVALPCCAGLMVIARPIMQLVFADSSQLASSLLVLGAPTIAFYSLSTVTISILQGIHRMRGAGHSFDDRDGCTCRGARRAAEICRYEYLRLYLRQLCVCVYHVYFKFAGH